MKRSSMVTRAVVGGFIVAAGTLVAQSQQQTPPPAGAAAGAPQGGGGRGNRAPLTEADAAEIAKLEAFPAWTRNSGDGNFFIGPDYAPAPEQTPKDGVPKGRIETFTMNAADS